MSSQRLNNVTITLTSDCMGRPRSEKRIADQSIKFIQGEKITPMSVEGKLSIGGTAHSVEWVKGNADDLKDVTQISVTTSNGGLIVSGDLSWNQPPKTIADGVQFWINPEA